MKQVYRVSGQVKHDGKLYAIGSSIELTVEQAERLKKSGAVEDVAAAAPAEPNAATTAAASAAPAVPTEHAERIAAIVAAIGKLDTADNSQWMNSGAPKVPAVEAVTGWQLTAKERDAAWAQTNPQ